MKIATIGHLAYESSIKQIPKEFIKKNMIVSPEINFDGIKGHILGLKRSSQQIMNFPLKEIRNEILKIATYAQNELNVNLIQLGALTTSVTSGGLWFLEQDDYNGFINHGDSYTALIASKAVEKILKHYKKNPSELELAIVGAYGIIGEALSKILVPNFNHSILIGRKKEKLDDLSLKINGSFETTVDLKTKNADVIITATSHPKALLNSSNLKKNAIIVDVSQPPNLSKDVCIKRSDIVRIDGGLVDFPYSTKFQIPDVPYGKLYSCIVEVIMQAKENHYKNHLGSIDIEHLKTTETWGKKYGYSLNELTNFGKKIII